MSSSQLPPSETTSCLSHRYVLSLAGATLIFLAVFLLRTKGQGQKCDSSSRYEEVGDINGQECRDESPCICSPHISCCREHGSIRARNVPPTQTNIPGQKSDHKTQAATFQSNHTLTPIHFSIPYHLALDHLACIRRWLGPGIKTAFIPERSWDDSASSTRSRVYYWSSEIYFHQGSFFQKQSISFSWTGTQETETLIECPHRKVTISDPEYSVKDGFRHVQACITNQPPLYSSHPMTTWSSSQGRYAQIIVCTKCHSDAECVLRLRGCLHVRYTCFRHLGQGTDLQDPTWYLLLTKGGRDQRQRTIPDVYERVWHVAYLLQRPDLEEFSHRTPNGVLDLSTKKYYY